MSRITGFLSVALVLWPDPARAYDATPFDWALQHASSIVRVKVLGTERDPRVLGANMVTRLVVNRGLVGPHFEGSAVTLLSFRPHLRKGREYVVLLASDGSLYRDEENICGTVNTIAVENNKVEGMFCGSPYFLAVEDFENALRASQGGRDVFCAEMGKLGPAVRQLRPRMTRWQKAEAILASFAVGGFAIAAAAASIGIR